MRQPSILVVGEALLDVDVEGTASRLAPDAPVPVVDVEFQRMRPGGAALAAALTARRGCRIRLATPLGTDSAGAAVRETLEGLAVEVAPLPLRGETPVKRRVRVADQALLRLDEGNGVLASDRWTSATESAFARALDDADVVLVSDYGRGVTVHPRVRALLAEWGSAGTLIWDPHPRGGDPVPATTIATPNLTEAHAALGGTDRGRDWLSVLEAAARLATHWPAMAVCVTAGARGAVMSYGGSPPVAIPARPRMTRDSCGAGDQFAAALTLEIARGRVLTDAVASAVQAAGDFVERGGAAGWRTAASPPDHSMPAAAALQVAARVRAAGGTVVATGGCFDLLHAGHLATLSAARSLGDCLIVLLNSDASVRALKGASRPLVAQADRARVLAELACVDAVHVFDDTTPDRALEEIQPHLWVKGGDYRVEELPEQATIARWGGQVVTVPYLPGHSTSALVAAARWEETS